MLVLHVFNTSAGNTFVLFSDSSPDTLLLNVGITWITIQLRMLSSCHEDIANAELLRRAF